MDWEKFDWGVPENEYKFILNESLDKIYERFFEVEENDIVVDFGAFAGSFTYSILDKKPEHCWVMEPIDMHFRTLYKNLKGYPVSFVRGAISNDKEANVVWCGAESKSMGFTFKEFITNNCIDKIDFFKTDCEGGEYIIFTEENFDYIKNNVKKIAGEWHLSNPEFVKNFIHFRDNILTKFDNYHVMSVDGVDIKWDLFNDHFTEYYNEVIIYIDNR